MIPRIAVLGGASLLNIHDEFPHTVFGNLVTFKKKPTVIVWLRHFGCRFFQEAKLLLPHLHRKLAEQGIDLLCVVQGTKEEAALFWPFEDIPYFPDPDKRTYRTMGFEKTNLLKIFFPNADLKKRRVAVSELGCSMNKSGTKSKSSDILQLPGLVLVDSNQKIVWIHRSTHTGDLDLSEALVDRVANALPK